MINKKSTFDIHFILGIGRSGTSLLSSLLDTHPHLKCTPEAVFLVFFLHKYKNQNISLEQFNLMLEHIKIYGTSHPWVGWKFDENAALSEFTNLKKEGEFLSFKTCCEILYRNFKNQLGLLKTNPSIIDKNPSYSLYANHLHKVFTEAKFILIFRDYRANILSRKQSVYLKSPDVAFNAFRWRLFNKKLLRFAKENPSISFLLKYENLVLDKEKYLNQLLTFFGEEPSELNTLMDQEELILNDEFEIPEVYQERYSKKYSDLNKEVNTSRISSWEVELSQKEIAICDAFCGEIGKELGYMPKYSLSKLKKFYYYCIYIVPITKAFLEIKKDALLFFMPPSLKVRRLKKSYQKIGLIKK